MNRCHLCTNVAIHSDAALCLTHSAAADRGEVRYDPDSGWTIGASARPLDDWHEDYGYVVWWTWRDGQWLGEPSYIGSPLCDDWPDYHTHWTPPPPFPAPVLADPCADTEVVLPTDCDVDVSALREDFGRAL